MMSRPRKIVLVLAVLMMLSPAVALAGIVQLPRTGQAKCYGPSGNAISCSGTGQDGDVLAGSLWPAPRFTVNTDGTVTDNLTGLIWSKNASTPKAGTCTGGAMKWQDALDYVKCLNANNYLGHSDWRMPNVVELESLVHAQQSSSSTWLNSQGFSGVESDFYWSSTTLMSNKAFVQAVFIGEGTLYSNACHKVYWSHLVWPVRSGQTGSSAGQAIWRTGQTGCYDKEGLEISCAGAGQDGEFQAGGVWPSPRFNDNGDETVTDGLAGLMWTKDANTPGPVSCGPAADKTWQEALDYIGCLNAGKYLGYDDWRLPNRKELFSLVDYSKYGPAIPAGSPFVNVQSDGYWSSTSRAFSNSQHFAWFIDMNYGYIDSDDKSLYSYTVWPVRSGEFAPPGVPAIGVSPASVDFGNVGAGSKSPEQTFTISNAGTADLEVGAIGAADGDDSMLGIAKGTCSSLTPTIPAGSSCTVKVTYTAASVGAKSTTLRITSNDPDTAGLDLALSLTGVQQPCACAVSPNGKSLNPGGAGGFISVSLKSPCNWTASSNADWLTITSGNSGGKSGKVGYSVSENTGTTARTGSITVEGKAFAVVQQGRPELSSALSEVTAAKSGKYYRFSGSITAHNNSEAKASGVTAKVYLSSDAAYDAGDKLLGAVAFGTASANAKNARSLSGLKTQTDPSGKYLVVVIDPANKIKEADETNNTAVSSVIP